MKRSAVLAGAALGVLLAFGAPLAAVGGAALASDLPSPATAFTQPIGSDYFLAD